MPTKRLLDLAAPSQFSAAPDVATTEIVPLPRELYLESTNRCNELCDQCPRTHLGREPDRDLSLDEVIRITDQLPELERVVLHGLGEPLLNPQLPAIVAQLRSRGAYVLFNSNATALSERMGRALIEANLNELRVSLDGARPETYARVRGVNAKALPKIIRNVAGFTRMRDEMGALLPRVSFWFTAMRENLPELPRLVEIALATGVREIYVQRLIYFGEGLARADQALFRRAREEEVEIIAETGRRCAEAGIAFQATGSTTPVEYITQGGGRGAASVGRLPAAAQAGLHHRDWQCLFLLLRAVPSRTVCDTRSGQRLRAPLRRDLERAALPGVPSCVR